MDVLAFALDAGKLKTLSRSGWVREGIPNAESVADHSYRVALLALMLGPRLQLKTERVVTMALLHDLGESKIGDIVTARGAHKTVHRGEKDAKEAVAMQQLLEGVSRADLLEIFKDFQGGDSPEAQIIHQLDKLEMAIQAYEYEQAHHVQLQEFFDNAVNHITNPALREVFDRLLKRRK